MYQEKLLHKALEYYGLNELPGPAENNPVILQFFKEIGHQWVKNDETAWCSAFINYIATKCGYESSGKLNARSWLTVGWQVETPKPGDVVILWREARTSWKGHVGLFIRQDQDLVYILGGNQSNQVNIKPYRKSRVLEYRRLKSL